jgi:hypothetical protein
MYFLGGGLKEGDYVQDLGIDGRSHCDFQRHGSEGVDWINLAKDRAQWWAVLNSVMNLGVHTHPCRRTQVVKVSVRPAVGTIDAWKAEETDEHTEMGPNPPLPPKGGVRCKVFSHGSQGRAVRLCKMLPSAQHEPNVVAEVS